jgi:hypothetical protein
MYDLIRETFFGRIVHLASRGKLFPAAEQRDPSKVQRYTTIKSVFTSRTSECATPDAPEGEKVDPESGRNFQLVEWDENDPEV